MQALANISQFESLGNVTEKPQGTLSVFNPEHADSCPVENVNSIGGGGHFPKLVGRQYSSQSTQKVASSSTGTGTTTPDPISTIAPIVKTMMNDYIPTWGKTLRQEVNDLGQRMERVENEVVGIRTLLEDRLPPRPPPNP